MPLLEEKCLPTCLEKASSEESLMVMGEALSGKKGARPGNGVDGLCWGGKEEEDVLC